MSSPPQTPPSKSRWGRVIRRASTALAISRPETPERDSDTSSLRRTTSRDTLSILAPSIQPKDKGIPTPIAESPAREADAIQQETIGPSPLARQITQPVEAPTEPVQPPAAAVEVPSRGAVEEEVASSPTGYIPPPVIDSSAGNPGAFSDLPEDLPRPNIAVDPFSAAPEQEASAPSNVDLSLKNPGAYTDNLDDIPQSTVTADPFAATAPALEPRKSESYFDKPIVESVMDFGTDEQPEHHEAPTNEFATAVVENTAIEERAPSPLPLAPVEAPAPVEVPAPVEAPAPVEVHAPVEAPAPVEVPAPAEPEIVAEVPAPHEEPADAQQHKTKSEAIVVASTEPDLVNGEAASYYRGEPSGMPIPNPAAVSKADEAPESTPEIHAPKPTFGAAVMPSVVHSYPLPSYSSYEHEQEEHTNAWGGISPSIAAAAAAAVAAGIAGTVYVHEHHKHEQEAKRGLEENQHEHEHDVWATGTAAPAMPSAHHGEEEEQRMYTSVLPMPIPIGNGNGNAGLHSRDGSIRMPNPHPIIDPFADPVPEIAISHLEQHPPMPIAQHTQERQEAHEDSVFIMPLPARHEVIPSSSIHRVPSHASSYGGVGNGNGNGKINSETDERIPLLARPHTPSKKSNVHDSLYTALPSHTLNASSISPLVAVSPPSSWNRNIAGASYIPSDMIAAAQSQPRLHDLGWLEYHLPDGTLYYVHPTRRLTTDLNLRQERVLGAVEAWMEDRKNESVNVGVEGWLREVTGAAAKKARLRKGRNGEVGILLERYWVDHIARSVVKEDDDERRDVGYVYGRGHGYPISKGKKPASAGKNEEDQLDLEYRFWSFMEAYPAHTSLPAKARGEAMDVLTWAWTDRLLPSHRPIPSPFGQEECQELMNLLKSFTENSHHHDDHGIQTRVVARILLRVAHWRQTYFRPNKPLPKDVSTGAHPLPVSRRPFRRAFFDFFISCLCLGIPYIFLERARLSSRMDAESGLMRNSPMVVIGACTCLVAAIVLSASVTFLSLPGLDSVARTAGMVAVLFAAFTMAATGLAVLRHKSDLERPVPHVGVEGLMVISRRTVALSLPLVFLAYSTIAFVTGIVLYAYRGISLSDPSMTKSAFEDYTRWTVVGVLGILAGIVTTSMLVLRR